MKKHFFNFYTMESASEVVKLRAVYFIITFLLVRFLGDIPYLLIEPFISSIIAKLWVLNLSLQALNMIFVGYFSLRVVFDLRAERKYLLVVGFSVLMTLLFGYFINFRLAQVFGAIPSILLAIYLIKDKNEFVNRRY